MKHYVRHLRLDLLSFSSLAAVDFEENEPEIFDYDLMFLN